MIGQISDMDIHISAAKRMEHKIVLMED